MAGIVLFSGGCAPLSPEEKLRWDLTEDACRDAARECVGHYGTVRLVRVSRDVMPHATRLLRVILALALPTVLAGAGSAATGG